MARTSFLGYNKAEFLIVIKLFQIFLQEYFITI